MAEALKILGQDTSVDAAAFALTAPPGAGKAHVVSSLVICNTNAAAVTVSVHVLEGGGTASRGNAVIYNLSLAASETLALTLGMTLGPADSISVQASTAWVVFTAFGSEVS